MIKRIGFLLFLNLSLIILNGCGDNPASIGRDLLKDDRLNVVEKDSFTDTLKQTSSYFRRVFPVKASISGRILAGKNANVECSTLMKFSLPLADTTAADILNGNINVLSAKVLLIQNYSFGDSTAPFDFSVHSILSSWSDNSFTSDSLAFLNYDPVDASSNRSYIKKDSLEFNLDNQLVLNWLKAKADTNIPPDNGIYIKPSESVQKVVGFAAGPTLSVVIEKTGVYQDTLTFAPYSQTTAAAGSIPSVNSENIVVQNSVEIESRLWFDASSVPKTALINYAELTLTLDTTETIRGSNYTKYVRIFSMTDSSNNSIDSTIIASISVSGNQYKGDITHYVQNWVNKADNQGILITPAVLGEGVELLSFKGSSSADFSSRPRLKIVYTTKR